MHSEYLIWYYLGGLYSFIILIIYVIYRLDPTGECQSDRPADGAMGISSACGDGGCCASSC